MVPGAAQWQHELREMQQAEELHTWLANVQAKLQLTMQEVTNKLEETKLLAYPPSRTALREVAQSTKSEGVECVLSTSRHEGIGTLPGKVDEQEGEAVTKEDGVPEGFMVSHCGPNSIESNKVAVETSEAGGGPSAYLAWQCDGSQLTKPRLRSLCTLSAPDRKHTELTVEASETHVFEQKKKGARCLKDCLLRLFCYRRRSTAPVAKKKILRLVEPTVLCQYSEREHHDMHVGLRLTGMRKEKLVTVNLWEERIRIQDARGKMYLPSQWSKSWKDERGELQIETLEPAFGIVDGAEVYEAPAFPLQVMWRWLSPNDLPAVSWKESVWWKLTGLLNNNDLRAFSIRFHARMHHLEQKVKRLSEDLVEDRQKALAENSTMAEQTESSELKLVIDTLIDIDELLSLGFRCGEGKRTIGEVLVASGCCFDTFLETYLIYRNNALLCITDGQRKELVNAATRGVDGLEILFQQLMAQIDQNDLMVFKMVILFFNVITCVGQFAWSDFVVPALQTTTPVPSWQTQIADLLNRTSGG